MTDRNDEDADPSPSEDKEDAAPPSGTNQTLWVGLFLILGLVALLAALFILTDAALFRGRYIVTTHVADAGGIRRGLEGEYDVPVDSKVLLKSSGLLGGMVADIVPGKAAQKLKNGDTVAG